MRSADRLIDSLRSTLKLTEKKLASALKENELMKQLVKTVTKDWDTLIPPTIDLRTRKQGPGPWSDRSKKFARVRSQLLETAIMMAKRDNVPLHHSEIIDEAKRMHPTLEYTDESTLTARLREMRNPMGLLKGYPDLPEGYYFPSKKGLNDAKQV